MQIDPNLRAGHINEVASANSSAPRAAKAEALAVFQDADALNQALRDEKEVREAKVEKALNMVGQVQWPPAETIRRIANLLAMKINRPNE